MQGWQRWAACGIVVLAAACNGDEETGPPESISLTLSTSTLSLEQGQSGTVTASVSRGGGYDGTVTVTVTGAPSTVLATIEPANLSGATAASTITLEATAAAAPGEYDLTVQAAGPGVDAQTAELTLTITELPAGEFAIAVSPNALSAAQGTSTSTTVTVTRTNFTDDITFSAENVPTGVTATFDPTSTNATTSTLTLDVAADAPAGAFTINVIGTAGEMEQSVDLALTVTEPAGSFTIALSPTSVSAVQGASATTTVTVTRDGFDDEITFSAADLPAGVTATFDPVSTMQTTSTLTLAVGAATTPGTYTIGVTGTAGKTEQSADLSLTVTEPGPGTDVTWSFCEASGLPVWVAYQDGDGAWIQAPNDGNDNYEFALSSGRGGIAFVTANGTADMQILYGSADELVLLGENWCENSASGTKTLNGSVAGVAATDQAWVSMGGASAFVIPALSTDFTLENVLDGPRDLIASRVMTTNGENPSFEVDKFILRRDLDLADGATIPVLDFDAAEAFDPAMNTVTLANAGTDLTYLTTAYVTDNGAVAPFFTGTAGEGNELTYAAIPADRQEATDLHQLFAFAVPDAEDPTEGRFVLEMLNEAADRTLTFGPPLDVVDVTTIGGSTYPRPAAAYMIQSEYDRFWNVSFVQTQRSVDISATSDYLENGQVILAVPDFSGTTGWDEAAWALMAGVLTDWQFSAIGWDGDGGIITTPFMEGLVALSGFRSGTITP